MEAAEAGRGARGPGPPTAVPEVATPGEGRLGREGQPVRPVAAAKRAGSGGGRMRPTAGIGQEPGPVSRASARYDRSRLRIQPVDATVWLNSSPGVWKPRVFPDLSFNCRAIALS